MAVIIGGSHMKLLTLLLQIFNAVALMAATIAGAFGGALGLNLAASSLGIPSNYGIAMIGFGLGGLAGFFLWAIPQMPRRARG
jgi:hypothetical protein